MDTEIESRLNALEIKLRMVRLRAAYKAFKNEASINTYTKYEAARDMVQKSIEAAMANGKHIVIVMTHKTYEIEPTGWQGFENVSRARFVDVNNIHGGCEFGEAREIKFI